MVYPLAAAHRPTRGGSYPKLARILLFLNNKSMPGLSFVDWPINERLLSSRRPNDRRSSTGARLEHIQGAFGFAARGQPPSKSPTLPAPRKENRDVESHYRGGCSRRIGAASFDGIACKHREFTGDGNSRPPRCPTRTSIYPIQPARTPSRAKSRLQRRAFAAPTPLARPSWPRSRPTGFALMERLLPRSPHSIRRSQRPAVERLP